jgi:hypothetical protein
MRATRRLPLGGSRDRRARQRLASHPLLPLVFDAAWYATRYRDVFRAGVDPLTHYLGPGAREGRDPGPYVDVSFYLTQVPALPTGGLAALDHLLTTGIASGVRTSPYIDLGWYRSQQDGVPTDPVRALQHLVMRGGPAHHAPGPFVDLAWYAARHPELRMTRLDPLQYFLAHGAVLRRFPHPLWMEERYVADNEYVRFALSVGKYLHGFEQFCAVGHREVARGAEMLTVLLDGHPHEFVEERYLAANPDVAEAVAAGHIADGVSHLFGGGHRDVAAGHRRLAPPTRTTSVSLQPGGRAASGDVLLLLVHFDVDGIVDPHVLLALDTYLGAGIDVCFIAVDLDDEALAPAHERSVWVVRRTSNDPLRDFGAWDRALQLLGTERLAAYRRIVLANDSAYFPVRDPSELLQELRTTPLDLWAATDSFSGGRYHLQSFMLSLSPQALAVLGPELSRRAVESPEPTKLALIQRFEAGLTAFALEAGLSVGAFRSVAAIEDLASALSPPYPRPLARLGITITNQTHHAWRSALEAGLPYLKVELLRDNPLDLDTSGWTEALTDASCSPALVGAHLERVTRGRLPKSATATIS